MSQQQKNTPTAQVNSEMHTEAVLKFQPLASSKIKDSSAGPTDKDGFEGNSDVFNFAIEVALNGFFVIISYVSPEIPDERYIVHTLDEVVALLQEKF